MSISFGADPPATITRKAERVRSTHQRSVAHLLIDGWNTWTLTVVPVVQAGHASRDTALAENSSARYTRWP
jgi:hypothetical protein